MQRIRRCPRRDSRFMQRMPVEIVEGYGKISFGVWMRLACFGMPYLITDLAR